MASPRRERPSLSPQREMIYREISKQLLSATRHEYITSLSVASKQAVADAIAFAEDDPYGDGDQTPLPDTETEARLRASITDTIEFCKKRSEYGEAIRAAWVVGLDSYAVLVSRHPSTTFHLACLLGDADYVSQEILYARNRQRDGERDALKHLLEARLGQLRMAPLHYVALGSKVIRVLNMPFMLRFCEVSELLTDAGARIDSKDLVGSTPLGIASGMHATKASAKLVPVLLKRGADPNAKLRFGQALIAAPIAANNVEMMRILMNNGVNLSIDTEGVPPVLLAAKSPELMCPIMEARRRQMLKTEKCGGCGVVGVSKFCAACRMIFYCSKECQIKGWKEGHKQECMKPRESGNFIDIEIGVDTFESVAAEIKRKMVNTVSGVKAKSMITGKEEQVGFILKMSTMFPKEEFRQEREYEPYLGCVKVEEKNGDFLVLKKAGRVKEKHDRLRTFINDHAPGVSIVYVLGSWMRRKGSDLNGGKTTEFCRLDISRDYPPPKPVW